MSNEWIISFCDCEWVECMCALEFPRSVGRSFTANSIFHSKNEKETGNYSNNNGVNDGGNILL